MFFWPHEHRLLNIKLGEADEFLMSKVDLDCGAL